MTGETTTTKRESTVLDKVGIPRKEENDGYITIAMLKELKSTRNSADFSKGAVTSRHSHDKKYAATIPADIIAIGGKFKFFKENGKIPAYGWMRVRSVNINLRDGLKPNPDGSVTGRIEVKARDVTKKGGQIEEGFLYLNVYPLLEGEVPEFELTINAEREKPQDESEVDFGPTVGTHREIYIHLKPLNN